MIIGFAQRRQTVSEAARPIPQGDFFLDVRSMIVSEINYNISFEAPASNMGRTANVGDNQAGLLGRDALFGTFNASTGDLEDLRLLFNGTTILENLLTLTIINDFTVEPLECFTISIVSPDRGRGRDTYECFDDFDNMDSFFCLHEVCIEDDDGLFRDFLCIVQIYILPYFQNHLLLSLLRQCILSLKQKFEWRCVSISLALVRIFLITLFV